MKIFYFILAIILAFIINLIIWFIVMFGLYLIFGDYPHIINIIISCILGFVVGFFSMTFILNIFQNKGFIK